MSDCFGKVDAASVCLMSDIHTYSMNRPYSPHTHVYMRMYCSSLVGILYHLDALLQWFACLVQGMRLHRCQETRVVVLEKVTSE